MSIEPIALMAVVAFGALAYTGLKRRGDEQGQAIVEMALILPIFLAVILGGVALLWTIFSMGAHQNATNTLAAQAAAMAAEQDRMALYLVKEMEYRTTLKPACVDPLITEDIDPESGVLTVDVRCTTSPVVPETAYTYNVQATALMTGGATP